MGTWLLQKQVAKAELEKLKAEHPSRPRRSMQLQGFGVDVVAHRG